MRFRILHSLTLAACVLCVGAHALPQGGAVLSGVDGEPLVKAAPSPTLRTPLEKRPLLPEPGDPLPARPDDTLAQPLPALPPLIERMVRSEDPELRHRSIEGIAALPAAVAETQLLLLCGDADERVRLAAAQQLVELNPDGLVHRLLDLLFDPVSPLNISGDAMGVLSPMLGSAMLAVFNDSEVPASRRAVAAWCLGQMRYADAFAPLQAMLWSDTTELAYACLDALFWIDDPRSAEDWVQLSTYDDPWVQTYAAAGMARTPSYDNLDAMNQMASGQSNAPLNAQQYALQGLSVFPPEEVVPRLMMILRFNLPLREDTLETLRKVTGFNAGRYPDNWFEWYREASAPGGLFAPVEETAEAAPPPLVPTGEGNSILDTVGFVPPGFQP